eukprot:COSAG02_NODE_20_length_53673_cov_86.864841_46_plen_647_part_00
MEPRPARQTRTHHAMVMASPPFSPPHDEDADDGEPARKRRRPSAQCPTLRSSSRPNAVETRGAALSLGRPLRGSHPAQDLRDALDRLQAAEQMKAVALQAIEKALPKVERMVQQSTRALAAHADFCPSLWHASDTPGRAVIQSNLENQSACKCAASSLRHALRNETLSEAAYTSVSVARAGNELFSTASIVFHRREQLESTLSAHSSDHNSRRSLCLRVLSIEYLRLNVLGNLSLRKLWSLRRVCRDFQQWVGQECAKLQAVPFCNQSAYGGISMVNPGNLVVYKLEHWAAMKQDAAIACGTDGSIYRVGGFMREGMSTEADPVAVSSVDVWRPSSARGGGSWHTLPNMKTARTHARACVVQLTGGGEALVVVGGRERRMSNVDFTTVEMLRLSSQEKSNGGTSTHVSTVQEWTEVPQHLPTRRRGFAVVAYGADRIAVVGGEIRTPAAVVGGVVVDAVREALRTVEILEVTTGRWFRAPDLRRARINPRVGGSAAGALYVVGGSSVPGPSQLSGEHIAMCEHLPARLSCPELETFGSTPHSTTEAATAHVNHDTTEGAVGGISSVVSCGGDDTDWKWSDIGEIPRPEAYAAMKLQVQVINRTLLIVQPGPPAGGGHLAPRKDSAIIFDVDSRTWHFKADVKRMRS